MNDEKVTLVVEKMVENADQIMAVEKSADYDSSGNEYYFTYPGTKFLWSVAENSRGEHSLFFYPDNQDKNDFLRFASSQLGITGPENLKNLFKLIESKAYGFDQVLKEILG